MASRVVLERLLSHGARTSARRRVLLRVMQQNGAISPSAMGSLSLRSLSSMASATTTDNNSWNDSNHHHHSHDKEHSEKHCGTCTCGQISIQHENEDDDSYACGSLQHEDDYLTLPPPLPDPVYSVHKRVLPANLTALSSSEGRKYLTECLVNHSANSYFSLTEQFVNQSDPAFCGVTTLLMVLNAMCIDPNVKWRGGWRWYGSEDVLLDRCCLSAERIRRVGISLEEFQQLGQCHGLLIDLKRPFFESDKDDNTQQQNGTNTPISTKSVRGYSLEEFRNDIKRVLVQNANGDDDLGTCGHNHHNNSILVTSFSRSSLGQTGDGHFSPLAAFHEATDKVLLLDVARFKYSPYWVDVSELYDSMTGLDSVTKKPRGWFVMHPPRNHAHLHDIRRPAEVVPNVGESDSCPVGKVKVLFCPANPKDENTTP